MSLWRLNVRDSAMPLMPDKLPDSSLEITTSFWVAGLALLGGLARILAGRKQDSFRYYVGTLLMSVVAGLVSYSIAVHFVGTIEGFPTLAIALVSGIIADRLLPASTWIADFFFQKAFGVKLSELPTGDRRVDDRGTDGKGSPSTPVPTRRRDE